MLTIESKGMEEAKVRKQKKKVRAPNLLWLTVALIILASILTYIVPSGEYDLDSSGNVIAGTFHFVENVTVSPIKALSMILDGMNGSGYIIFIVMLMGGSICSILSYGSIENVISYTIHRMNGKSTLVPVLFCMILMSLLASVGGSDAFVAFVPVGVIVARKLKLDPIAAVAIFFMSSFVGFFSGPFCMTAQTIARVEPLSGFFVRLAELFFMTGLLCVYVARYCHRILKNPANSLMGNTDWLQEIEEGQEEKNQEEVKLDKKAVAALLLLIISFVIIAVIVPMWGLDYNTFVLILMILAVITGLIYKKSLSEIANSFISGVMQMAGIAVIIGFARTIGLVMETGGILHTIIYYITIPLGYLGAQAASVFLFLSNAIINFFIPSGSGQAAVVLPLMLPIGDVLGITDQVIVSAFIYGDGLTNLCIPTFSALMGALMIAKVPFGKWFRFVFPFIIISFVCLSVLLVFLTGIGWTG